MTDPYRTLGVSRDASDDDIKKAYRALARKYHPDNYAGSDLADLAQEKMKEINEAYDTVQKERAASKNAGASGTYGSSSYGRPGGTGSAGGGDSYSSASSARVFAEVRRLMKEGRYTEAGLLLDNVPAAGRGAEWEFLQGCRNIRRGYTFDAARNFEAAHYMAPDNPEYAAALENLRRNTAERTGTSSPSSANVCGTNCSAFDILRTAICLDCLCGCGNGMFRCC